ncbi:MAG TPA: diaminopimelate epimerase [Longimicrobiales bacterium]|nr:diaminopimelate epimerase [Longimicrobiales bacterium]
MAGLRFFKGQALGNDYLVVDAADLPADMSPALGRLICDRHRGAGSDGVLIGELDRTPFRLRIMNPDGTWAEKSGNGLRIFGAYLHHRGLVQQDAWFDVELPRDTVSMRVEDELDAGTLMIRAQMGAAAFDGQLIGFTPESGEALGYELELPRGGTADVNTVYLGNPHCVVFVDELRRDDFLDRAPQLCTHAAFEAGTNVQFARVVGPSEIEAWIWERGAGETLASGSSACAVAAAAVKRGFVPAGRIMVSMEGGEAEITVGDAFDVMLLGPAQVVYEGWFLPGVAAVG